MAAQDGLSGIKEYGGPGTLFIYAGLMRGITLPFFYGNNAFWSGTSYGSASGQSLSTPFYGFSRIAFYQLGLFDLASGDIAWRGEIRTEGKGAANVTNSVFIRSVTSEVANELKASGLIN
jgi:hypothetical protein